MSIVHWHIQDSVVTKGFPLFLAGGIAQWIFELANENVDISPLYQYIS